MRLESLMVLAKQNLDQLRVQVTQVFTFSDPLTVVSFVNFFNCKKYDLSCFTHLRCSNTLG